MTLGVNTTIRTAWATSMQAAIDNGAGPGVINFYTSPRPATGAAITTQTLLGTITCPDPCGSAASGVLTFGTFVREDSAPAAGNAAWARITDSDGTFVTDASVGVTGSGADIELNSIAISLGGIIEIASGTLTAGNA